MSKKEDLLEKLRKKPAPRNFTVRELDTLMSRCGCIKYSGGRGSGIRYVHQETNRVLQFDSPHPGNELYRYQVKMVIEFLEEVEEM